MPFGGKLKVHRLKKKYNLHKMANEEVQSFLFNMYIKSKEPYKHLKIDIVNFWVFYVS